MVGRRSARPFLAVATAVLLLLSARAAAQTCTSTLTSTGTPPLNDLGAGVYRPGHIGGLYPGGVSTRPADHEAAGLDIARNRVVPRNAAGEEDPAGGLIGFISVGMSNTSQEFGVFETEAGRDRSRNPRLIIVNGAQGGQAAEDWVGSSEPWSVLRSRVTRAGLTPAQVQVAWLKQANRAPGRIGDFDAHALKLRSDLAAILRRLALEYPDLRLAYLSSRTRAYTDARNALNPEPFAYESGFSVRWVIRDQLEGVNGLDHELGEAPWLSWGPYLWVDGEDPRSDGLVWLTSDLSRDCTHPSGSGRSKVADQLMAFFMTDRTTASWFLRETPVADAPIVDVAPSSASGPVPLRVSFAVSATPAVAGATIAGYAWNFDDGTTSLAANPAKTFLVPGSHRVELTVSDSQGNTARVTIPITATEGEPQPPLIVAPASPLEEGSVGVPYRLTLGATGSLPIAWRVVAGELPPGLELSGSGVYAGTPAAAGTFRFTVEASNGLGSDTAEFSHTIVRAGPRVERQPVADAWVRDGSFAGQNFGADGRLAVRASGSTGQNARSYLRFDLRGLDGTCDRALLRLHAASVNGAGANVGALAVAEDSWSEAGITWNSMPATGSQLTAVRVDRAQAVFEFDITTLVRAELAGDALVSVCLRDPGPAGSLVFFDSREGAVAPVLEVTVSGGDGPAQFVRGDCNGDGNTDISDPVRLLLALFSASPPLSCDDACDTDDGGSLDISDAIGTLGMLFLGGSLPPAPFPGCGIDTTEDTLDCVSFPECPR